MIRPRLCAFTGTATLLRSYQNRRQPQTKWTDLRGAAHHVNRPTLSPLGQATTQAFSATSELHREPISCDAEGTARLLRSRSCHPTSRAQLQHVRQLPRPVTILGANPAPESLACARARARASAELRRTAHHAPTRRSAETPTR